MSKNNEPTGCTYTRGVSYGVAFTETRVSTASADAPDPQLGDPVAFASLPSPDPLSELAIALETIGLLLRVERLDGESLADFATRLIAAIKDVCRGRGIPL